LALKVAGVDNDRFAETTLRETVGMVLAMKREKEYLRSRLFMATVSGSVPEDGSERYPHVTLEEFWISFLVLCLELTETDWH